MSSSTESTVKKPSSLSRTMSRSHGDCSISRLLLHLSCFLLLLLEGERSSASNGGGLQLVTSVNANPIDTIELADTSHLHLVSEAAALEAGFETTSSDTTATTGTTAIATQKDVINVICTEDTWDVFPHIAAAFRTVNSRFSLVISLADTGAEVKRAFLETGLYDFAVAPEVPDLADYQTMPSLAYFPFVGMGLAFTYNVPPAISNGFKLSLSGEVLCRIHRGNITYWTDPSILVLNPNMKWSGVSSTQLIQIFTSNTATSTHETFVTYCHKIDPIFAATIPISANPTYTAAFITAADDIGLAGDATADTPWSIALTTMPRASAIPLKTINLKTNGGAIELTGDSNSVELNIIELASEDGSGEVDLTNPTNQQAWPISAFQYIMLDSTNTRTTCASKRVLLQFILWAYTNSIARALFSASSLVPLPTLIMDQFQLLDQLTGGIQCDNADLVSANDATLYVAADFASADIIHVYSKLYSTIDTSFTFTTRALTETLSLQRLTENEAAFALVRTGLFDDADLATIDANGFVSIPAFLVGVAPIFRLPNEIMNMTKNVTGQLYYNLPTLYPLVLDVDTLTRIFLGNVTSWLDSDLIKLNPQLASWFVATNANTTLTVIVGSTDPTDPSAGAKVLFKTMQSSDVAQNPIYRKIFGSSTEVISNNAAWKKSKNPFGLILNPEYMDVVPTNMIILDFQTRLSIKTSVVPGAISYRDVGGQGIGVSDETVEFRMIQTNTDGVREIVAGTTANMNKCNAPHVDDAAVAAAGGSLVVGDIVENPILAITTQRSWINKLMPPPGCYPLFVVISLVMPMQYTSNKSGTSSTNADAATATASTSSDTCHIARHGIEFANYIQSDSTLTLPAEQLGLVRLASSDVISQLSRSVFYATVCDDSPVLVTVPSYFRISDGITQFGFAIGAIGLITTAVSLILVMLYRHRVIIRSSSVPFLVLILCGIGFIYVSLIAWSAGPSPTSASCSVFIWFSQLGFMMVYIPLFAKTYRVWRIFSGSHLKVIKISNRRLMAWSLGAVLIDMILLSIWQGYSPLHPIKYARELPDHWDYYTHCSVKTNGLPFVIIEAVYKAGILLFGALMAFSTRNVKATFNESTQIAWSIYNTLLAAIIVAIMITFLNAIQSTLIIMVQILLLWMPFCTWALLFIPKFQLLFGKSENDVIEASRSELIPQEKSNGFSFASVAFMNSQQLRLYYDALKAQVIKVQQRLNIIVTKFEPTPANLGNDSGNHSGHGSKNHSRNGSKNAPTTLTSATEASINKPVIMSLGSSGMNSPNFGSFGSTKLSQTGSMTPKLRTYERVLSSTNNGNTYERVPTNGRASSMKVSRDSAMLTAARAGNYLTSDPVPVSPSGESNVTSTGIILNHMRISDVTQGSGGIGLNGHNNGRGSMTPTSSQRPSLFIKTRPVGVNTNTSSVQNANEIIPAVDSPIPTPVQIHHMNDDHTIISPSAGTSPNPPPPAAVQRTLPNWPSHPGTGGPIMIASALDAIGSGSTSTSSVAPETGGQNSLSDNMESNATKQD